MDDAVLVAVDFLAALMDRQDERHREAVRLCEKAKEEGRNFVVADAVVAALTDRLRKRFTKPDEFERAVSFLLGLWEEGRVFFYLYALSAWDEVMGIVLNSRGRLDFTDALLVVGAKRVGIEEVASFNEGFDGYLRRMTP